MTRIYLEESIGQCENTTLATLNLRTYKCDSSKNRMRRVMSTDTGTICKYHCERCMPDLFLNPNNYPVIRLIKRLKIKDPLYDDYIIFFKGAFC